MHVLHSWFLGNCSLNCEFNVMSEMAAQACNSKQRDLIEESEFQKTKRDPSTAGRVYTPEIMMKAQAVGLSHRVAQNSTLPFLRGEKKEVGAGNDKRTKYKCQMLPNTEIQQLSHFTCN